MLLLYKKRGYGHWDIKWLARTARIWAITRVDRAPWPNGLGLPPSVVEGKALSAHGLFNVRSSQPQPLCRSKCGFPEEGCPSECLAPPYLTAKGLAWAENNVFCVTAPVINFWSTINSIMVYGGISRWASPNKDIVVSHKLQLLQSLASKKRLSRQPPPAYPGSAASTLTTIPAIWVYAR